MSGEIDTQTKSIDDERYATLFDPRRPALHWSSKNREIVRRLLRTKRMTVGTVVLPEDL